MPGLADKWILKMQYIHTMKYYLTLKRNDILTHVATWMNLENLMLSDISQAQKDKYDSTLSEESRVKKSVETESRLVITRY
jgi:hypothetical protein